MTVPTKSYRYTGPTYHVVVRRSGGDAWIALSLRDRRAAAAEAQKLRQLEDAVEVSVECEVVDGNLS